jgi:tRNA-binding EMAP/Myf-like protein
MSQHVGYIVKIEHLRPHTNADRLQIATIFGNDVIVDLNVAIGDIGIYFPSDLQLSKEFCEINDLVRRKDENGNPCGGYLDPDKRNIRPIKLRGEKSDGLYLPIKCLEYTQGRLKIGDRIDVVNGHEICCKYIPVIKNKTSSKTKKCNKVRKYTAPVAPLFIEHADTEQLNYNLDAFKAGDQIEITLKMHGTSNRVAYVPVLKKFKRTLFDHMLGREGKPIYEYDYISGTRRTVLDSFDGGFYGSNAFRKQFEDRLRGKLYKGEEIYFEIVGFTNAGTPIMPIGDNNKVGKDFIKQYGDKTVFSYGCAPDDKDLPQSEMYVYRMTMTNEDGDVVEYSPDFMRYRCEQIGVKTVPVFYKGYIPAEYTEINTQLDNHTVKITNYTTPGEWVKDLAEEYYDGSDPIGKTHVREGVVVRIINRPKFCAYKTKNFSFKVIEGIIKDSAQEPDIEEAQDLLTENKEEINV